MSFDNEAAVTNNNDGDLEDRIIAKALAANGSQVPDPESDAPIVSARKLHSQLERGVQYALQKNNSTLLDFLNKTINDRD